MTTLIQAFTLHCGTYGKPANNTITISTSTGTCTADHIFGITYTTDCDPPTPPG